MVMDLPFTTEEFLVQGGLFVSCGILRNGLTFRSRSDLYG